MFKKWIDNFKNRHEVNVREHLSIYLTDMRKQIKTSDDIYVYNSQLLKIEDLVNKLLDNISDHYLMAGDISELLKLLAILNIQVSNSEDIVLDLIYYMDKYFRSKHCGFHLRWTYKCAIMDMSTNDRDTNTMDGLWDIVQEFTLRDNT